MERIADDAPSLGGGWVAIKKLTDLLAAPPPQAGVDTRNMVIAVFQTPAGPGLQPRLQP
jgi:hypothetical protein